MPLAIKSFPVKYLLFLLAATALPAVQGCAMAAPAAITYGVNKITAPAAATPQPAQPAAQAATQRTYPEYLTEMERINMEREKAGLQRRPIMSQEEWVSAEAAGRPAATPAPPPAPIAPAAPSGEKAAETK